jgi:plasmid replication initiation protein
MKEINNKLINDKSNDLIIQHNNLIEAKYQLTLQEKRIMLWLASKSKITDEDFKEHILSVKDFAKLINIKGDHLYTAIDKITHKLMQKIITIKSLDGKEFIKAAFLSGVKYHEHQGMIRLSFHPYLKPFMLQLKDQFTQIKLGDIIGLRSIHSIRIYEILKQYQSIKNRKIPLSDLKDFCGIKENQYKRFNDFKKDVLERVKKEINFKTDILIDYTEIKESRKVVAIEWTVKKKDLEQQNHFHQVQSLRKEYRSELALIESIIEYGYSKALSKRFIKDYGEDIVQNAVKAVDIQIEKGQVKNPKAMLRKAIEEKWKPDVYKKR